MVHRLNQFIVVIADDLGFAEVGENKCPSYIADSKGLIVLVKHQNFSIKRTYACLDSGSMLVVEDIPPGFYCVL